MVQSSKEAKAKWAAYFKAGLAKRSWDAMGFVRASGNRFTYKSANNWEAGRSIPDGDTVAEIADLFEDPESVALEAAGLTGLADRFARKVPPAPPRTESEPIDRGLAIIKSKGLPPDREALVIARYRQRYAPFFEDLDDIIDVLIEKARRSAEGNDRHDSRPA